jgi:hypothetical protein
MTKDTSHPRHGLFSMPPSRRLYRCINAPTNILLNSFYPLAIRLLVEEVEEVEEVKWLKTNFPTHNYAAAKIIID